MTTGKLIALIKGRRGKNHIVSNRESKRGLLQHASSKKIVFSVERWRKKLRHLKIQMRKCIAKLPKLKNRKPTLEKHGLTWTYFNSLLFMKVQVIQPSQSGHQHEGEPHDDTGNVTENPEPDDERDDTVSHDKMSDCSVESDYQLSKAETYLQTNIKRPLVAIKDYHNDHKKQIQDNLIEKPQMNEEWVDFMKDIMNDLRRISDPFLSLEVKSSIRRAVEHCVLKQLEKTLGAPENVHRKKQTGWATADNLIEQSQMTDEWDDFMKDIVNDLRRISDPFLSLEVKSSIRRAVEYCVLVQLEKTLNASENVHRKKQTGRATANVNTGK